MEEMQEIVAQLRDPHMEHFRLHLEAAVSAPFSSLIYQQRLHNVDDEDFQQFIEDIYRALLRSPIPSLSIYWSFVKVLCRREQQGLFSGISKMEALDELVIDGSRPKKDQVVLLENLESTAAVCSPRVSETGSLYAQDSLNDFVPSSSRLLTGTGAATNTSGQNRNGVGKHAGPSDGRSIALAATDRAAYARTKCSATTRPPQLSSATTATAS